MRKSSFAGSEAHLKILKESLRRKSPRHWNRWRADNPRVVPDLRGLVIRSWLRGFDLRRVKLDGATLVTADLGGVHLEQASLRDAELMHSNLSHIKADEADFSDANLRTATLEGAKLAQAVCIDTYFGRANLSGAHFTHAKLKDARFSGANLTRACFDGADLTGADLGRAVLDSTSFLGARLVRTNLCDAFIRRVKTDEHTVQRSLGVDVHVAWGRPQGEMITFTDANDIRLAQFHDAVEEYGAVASLIAAGARRVVLLLGRFSRPRKYVLNRLAAALRDRGKVAILFDFPGPHDREISDTVRFIAGMSQFIVVDMTDASSVPLELQATIPDLMVPVLPIVQSGEEGVLHVHRSPATLLLDPAAGSLRRRRAARQTRRQGDPRARRGRRGADSRTEGGGRQ